MPFSSRSPVPVARQPGGASCDDGANDTLCQARNRYANSLAVFIPCSNHSGVSESRRVLRPCPSSPAFVLHGRARRRGDGAFCTAGERTPVGKNVLHDADPGGGRCRTREFGGVAIGLCNLLMPCRCVILLREWVKETSGKTRRQTKRTTQDKRLTYH